MKSYVLAFSAAALALSASAYAASHAGHGMDPMGGKTVTRAEAEAKGREMFDKLDVNKDGKLDKADREARQIEKFRKMDADGNGAVSQAEFLAAHDRKPGEHKMDQGHQGRGGMGMKAGHGRGMMGMMMLKKADTNNDNAVSQTEFTAAMLGHFDKADANHDGKVTPEERKAAHKAMMEKMKAMRGMHGGMQHDAPPPPAK